MTQDFSSRPKSKRETKFDFGKPIPVSEIEKLVFCDNHGNLFVLESNRRDIYVLKPCWNSINELGNTQSG